MTILLTTVLLLMPMNSKKDEEALVYSTDHGRICPTCEQAVAECTCKSNGKELAPQGLVSLSLSTKGRKGKPVSVVSGVMLPLEELQSLGKSLKQVCGTGGTVKNGLIEVQGDNRKRIEKELTDRGYKVKLI